MTLIVVTGGSRGLGRALAVAAAEEACTNNSSFGALLLARNEKDMHVTERLVKAQYTTSRVACIIADLADLTSLDATLDAAFSAATNMLFHEGRAPDRAILFNNAGSLGEIASITQLGTLKHLRNAIDLNVTSSAWVTVRFLKWIRGLAISTSNSSVPASTTTIVNISSLAAIQPMETMGVYCAGKAARDMFHAVLGLEHPSSSFSTSSPATLKVLNYAPGPLDTDMQVELVSAPLLYAPTKEIYSKMRSDHKSLTADASARKCFKILRENTFLSGAHVDYYDVPDDEINQEHHSLARS